MMLALLIQQMNSTPQLNHTEEHDGADNNMDVRVERESMPRASSMVWYQMACNCNYSEDVGFAQGKDFVHYLLTCTFWHTFSYFHTISKLFLVFSSSVVAKRERSSLVVLVGLFVEDILHISLILIKSCTVI